MRRAAWILLLFFVFTIPWEYSLDLGAPWGNIARITGLLLLPVLVLANLQTGSMRRPSAFHVGCLCWLLWLALSALWSLDARSTAAHLPGYCQEIMIVWFLWELIETDADLVAVLCAYSAGAVCLSALTFASFVHPLSPEQVRFVPDGQDPNDVARFLVMGLPFAAWLASNCRSRWRRWSALAVIPTATAAVLLTASRGGFLACGLSLAGCGVVLWRKQSHLVAAGLIAAPIALAVLWLGAPHETLLRLATIPGQLLAGDLNQRWNIWAAGWRAFSHAPLLGAGAGSFAWAAGLAPADTAHNSALAIAVEGGLISLALIGTLLMAVTRALLRVSAGLRLALGTALAAWLALSFVSDVHESRTTWLLLGVVVAAGGVAERRDSFACGSAALGREAWEG